MSGLQYIRMPISPFALFSDFAWIPSPNAIYLTGSQTRFFLPTLKKNKV
jgi:hypothetical protein